MKIKEITDEPPQSEQSSNGVHAQNGHQHRRPTGLRPAAPMSAANGNEDVTRQAIRALLSSSEQTYEQFMNNFTVLTPEDVIPQPARSSRASDSVPSTSTRHSSTAAVQQVQTTAENTARGAPAVLTEEGELEEEMLDEGTRTGDIFDRPAGRRTSLVDNFLDIDSLCSSDNEDLDDDVITGGYTASFGGTLTENETSQGPANESATSQSAESKQQSTTQSTIDTQIDNDIDSMLPLNTTQSQTAQTSESAQRSQTSQTAQTNSIDIINPFRPQEILTNDEIDIIKPVRPQSADSCNDTDTEELVYDPSQDLPNPGEVVEDEELLTGGESGSSNKTNITKLEFSAIEADSENQPNESQTKPGSTSDDIQPFSLDDDFDYDNVVLTPKFSEQDIRYINETLKMGKSET